jgi:hypothetical protein
MPVDETEAKMTRTATRAPDDQLSPAFIQAGTSPPAPVAAAKFIAATLSEAERLAQLRDVLGPVNADVQPFCDAIRALVAARWTDTVVPLIDATWPALHDEPAGRKLRFLACNLYATAPYTVLFCSPRRPLVVDAPMRVGQWLRLSPPTLARYGARAVSWLGRTFPLADQRRIVVTAMFIATVDHVFDHCMDGLFPQERAATMKGVLDGTRTPDTPPLRLVRALVVAMQDGLDEGQRAAFAPVLARVHEWLDSEVKGMTGVPDPDGLCWRLAGVLGTIDGLVFPVLSYAGEGAREWMYGVSLFCQVMDDWIDAEKDRRDVRATPVLTGKWTIESVRESFATTVRGIQDLAKASGLSSRHYLAFVRDAYQLMAHEVMEAMVKGTAA